MSSAKPDSKESVCFIVEEIECIRTKYDNPQSQCNLGGGVGTVSDIFHNADSKIDGEGIK